MAFKQKKKKRKQKELKRRRKNLVRRGKCSYCHSRIEGKHRHITFSKGRTKKQRGRCIIILKKVDKITRDRFNASLGNCMSFVSYLKSYENAFKTLVDSVNNSGLNVDDLAIPILFTARHAMELGFKSNIKYFAKYSELTYFTNSHSHNLGDLFNGFKLHIRRSIINLKDKYEIKIDKDDIEEYEKYCAIVDGLVSKFEVLDKSSLGFKYPFDLEKKKVFGPNDSVNIIDIKELFEKTMILLHYTADVFSKYTDYSDFIEESYIDEMRSEYNY